MQIFGIIVLAIIILDPLILALLRELERRAYAGERMPWECDHQGSKD